MINDIKNKFKGYKPYINGYENMKRASVLIPIVEINNIHHILFEVRSKNLKHQPNEISFPGGKIESNETPYDAAIRETCEELGTFNDNIEIISSLDLLITPVKFIIHPYLGYIKNINNLNINKDEVDHTFLVPIKYLLENPPNTYNNTVKVFPDENLPYGSIPNQKDYKFESGSYPILFYKYKDYVIWGMTAKILENFLNFLSE